MAAPSNYAALVTGAGAAYRDIELANDAPFELFFAIEGEDLTDATFAADVRTLPDLQIVGTTMTVGAAALDGDDTLVKFSLSEAEVEALGTPPEPGRESVLYYRVHVTPSGGVKQLWLAGKFTRLGS